MANALQQAGAISDPSRFAALSMAGEQFTGLWTQAGPYRDAASAYLVRKFYAGSRFDRIIDGINREISAQLTDIRRPANISWNSSLFPAIRSFHSHKFIQDGQEIVKVMVDTDTAVYDASSGGKVLVYAKPAGAGRTRFLSIGPTLYMGNGATQVKWVLSSKAWKANSSSFADGSSYIVDSNLNIQQSVKAQTAKVTNILVTSSAVPGFRTVYLQLDPTTPLSGINGTQINLTLAGLTTRAGLNGGPWQAILDSALTVHFLATNAAAGAIIGWTAETGTASTGAGVTGGAPPIWSTTPGAITQDNTQQWVCKGSSIQNWGFAAPAGIIALTQAPVPSTLPRWQANTFYAPLFVIVDAGTYYKLTTDGITGGAAPAFDPVPGHTTADGSAVWTSLGTAAWGASTVYAVGAVVAYTYSYQITYTTYVYDPVTHTVSPEQNVQTITVTSFFVCTIGGTSGTVAPSWSNGVGTTTQDNTVSWQNMGSFVPQWTDIGATQKVAKETQIIGAGYLQNVQTFGKTGATEPTWMTDLGGYTADNGYLSMWKNTGPVAPGTPAGGWQYAYSGKNSITGEISTASPISALINVAVGNAPILTGVGLADTQIDQLVLWRTTQGGALLIYLDTIPNPGASGTWIYTDTTVDKGLNAFIAAPVADANDPPITGFTGPVYHLQRVWGFKDNVVYYSQTSGETVGSTASAFPPLKQFGYQARVIRLLPITVDNGGVLVFTSSGVYIILGTGTASNPFYSTKFVDKVILGGYDALDVFGTQIFLMEQNLKVSSLTIEYPFSPQSGYTEVGYAIGDQFVNVTTGVGPGIISGNLYNAATAYLSWNPNSSGDTGMYVADGSVGWFRMHYVSPPETGIVWSPRAQVVGGTSAVQNVETAPGVFNLLMGGNGAGAGTPILQRETTSTGFGYKDGGTTAYPAWDVKGVNLLCTTGEVAEVAHIGTKSRAVGARPAISVLLGEIAASSSRPWDNLEPTGNDPALTPKSISVFSNQYDLAQNGVATQGDSILTKFDYGSQAFGDELLEWGIFASIENERKEEAQAAK